MIVQTFHVRSPCGVSAQEATLKDNTLRKGLFSDLTTKNLKLNIKNQDFSFLVMKDAKLQMFGLQLFPETVKNKPCCD